MLKSLFCGGTLFLCASVLCGATASLESVGRKAFLHNEKSGLLKVSVKAENGNLSELRLSGTIAGVPVQGESLKLLKSGNKAVLTVPVETRLSVGKYTAELELTAKGLDNPVKFTSDVFIAPELHDRMPVLIWGYYPLDHRIFQEIGFTHAQQNWWRNLTYTDRMLCDGFRGMNMINLMKPTFEKPMRLQRNGSPVTYDRRGWNVSDKEYIRAMRQYTFDEAQNKLFEAPAVEGALLNSEFRDFTAPSFDKDSKARFETFAGYPIPQEVNEKNGVNYRTMKDFPVSRIISDKDPILTYYKWFWKGGDGWNDLNTVMDEAYRAALQRPFWSFYDPAVRVPPIWGSGGNVNFISHWVYATPDPINIGATTAELQAMAKGNPKQQVMNMTQIITYRSAVAPTGKKIPNMPAWAKEFPKASYVSLAPDMMKIAVWTQISRQVQGIMFHGAYSLFPNTNPKKDKKSGYQCTNTETKGALADILLNVVKPLGPALKRVPERKGEVAILESFASAMFADRSTWGWRGWPYECHLAALWGGLAPQVLYDETILRDGLGDVKVLMLPHCDVLTENVCKAILDFQKKGGIVIGDSCIVPAITPDITFNEYVRTGEPKADKAALQAKGWELKKALASYFRPYSETADPDLMTWVRSSKDTDYLFVINDKRTFGDYFGPWGVVMEKSVPNQGKVSVRRTTGVVYDLVTRKEVPFTTEKGNTVLDVSFDGKTAGHLYLLLPEKIGKVKLDLPGKVAKGETFAFIAEINFESGKSVKSIHPIAIEVMDSAGKSTDDSCFGALENGMYKQSVTIPLNAEPGKWKVTVRDLAAGKSITKEVKVQ